MVTLPAPQNLEEAANRSQRDITVTQLSTMMSMYEPTSLAKLSKKGAELHVDATRADGSLKLSPRREMGSPTSRGSLKANRRSSSHFREIPQNTIPENARPDEEQDSDDGEERKQAPAQQTE